MLLSNAATPREARAEPEVIDLTDSPLPAPPPAATRAASPPRFAAPPAAAAPAPASPAPAPARPAAPPAWVARSGAARLQAEFRALTAAWRAGALPQIVAPPTLLGDDLFTWRLRAGNFDADSADSAALNADLARFARKRGAPPSLLLEVAWPGGRCRDHGARV